MKLSVALMGHPKRQDFIDELVPRLRGVEVVLDEKNDRWDTGRRSLLAVDPSATHHLVVQDDAILCEHLLPACRSAAKAAGERPIGLYVGRVRPHQHTVTPAIRQAHRAGVPWVETHGPYWGVGIIIPAAHIPELVAWGDANPQIKNYDRRVAAWYERQKIKCWYTVPSLVDHRPVEENPSLIKSRTGNRRAHIFIGERDPRKIDWTIPPLGVIKSVRFRHRRSDRVVEVRRGSSRHRRLEEHIFWTEEDQNLAA